MQGVRLCSSDRHISGTACLLSPIAFPLRRPSRPFALRPAPWHHTPHTPRDQLPAYRSRAHTLNTNFINKGKLPLRSEHTRSSTVIESIPLHCSPSIVPLACSSRGSTCVLPLVSIRSFSFTREVTFFHLQNGPLRLPTVAPKEPL